jgi:hypothetical protein
MFFFNVINGNMLLPFIPHKCSIKIILQIKMGIRIFYPICYFYMLLKINCTSCEWFVNQIKVVSLNKAHSLLSCFAKLCTHTI